MVDRGGAVIQFNCFHRRQVGDQEEHAVARRARPDRTREVLAAGGEDAASPGREAGGAAQQLTSPPRRGSDGGGAMWGMGIDAQSMGRQWSPGPL